MWPGPARVLLDVAVGGFHEQALATTRQDLAGAGPATPGAEGRVQMRLDGGAGSALTAFTPRLGGLAIAGRRHSEANLLEAEPEPQQLQVGLSDTAAIAGWQIGLAATADMGHVPATGGQEGSSALVVGGQLAVSACVSMPRSAATPRCSANRVTGSPPASATTSACSIRT